MSIEAINYVTDLRRPKVTASEKLILLLIANHQNKNTGLCFPSESLLADESCLTERGVSKIITRLEHKSLLEVDRTTGHVNRYSFPSMAPTPERGSPPNVVQQPPNGVRYTPERGTKTPEPRSAKPKNHNQPQTTSDVVVVDRSSLISGQEIPKVGKQSMPPVLSAAVSDFLAAASADLDGFPFSISLDLDPASGAFGAAASTDLASIDPTADHSDLDKKLFGLFLGNRDQTRSGDKVWKQVDDLHKDYEDDYLKEKLLLTKQAPRKNPPGFFLKAVQDNWPYNPISGTDEIPDDNDEEPDDDGWGSGKPLPKEKADAIPTGIARLDDVIGGGIAPGELGLLFAATGYGKSHFLLQQLRSASIQMKRSWWLNLDMAEHTLIERRKAMWEADAPKIHKDQIRYYHNDQHDVTVAHIEKMYLEIPKYERPRVICVDYTRKIAPVDKALKTGSWPAELEAIKLLAQFAAKYSIAVWTVSQGGREAVNKQRVTLDDVAGSFDSLAECSIILTAGATNKMQTSHRLTFGVQKVRNSDGQGRWITANRDFSKSQIWTDD